MTWNPVEHTDDDNLRWCWLRAIEWGRWPMFLSQPVAPLLLVWLSWDQVIFSAIIANLFWAGFVRYQFVSVAAASAGPIVVRLRWLTWPLATTYLYWEGRRPECCVSLAWPILVLIIGAFPTTRIGRIQVRFMRELGYEPTASNPLSERA